MCFTTYSQTTEKGTYYSAISYDGAASFGIVSLIDFFGPSSHHNTGLTLSNEWVTDYTFDGNNENSDGDEYFDEDKDKENRSSFGMTANFGSFIIDGLLTGLGVYYGQANWLSQYTSEVQYWVDNNDVMSSDVTYTDEYVTSLIKFQPFIRYYIPLNSSSIFIGTSYSLGRMKLQNIYTRDYDESPYVDQYGDVIFEDYSNIEDEDYEEPEPYRLNKISLEAGLCLAILKNDNLSINMEPSINFSFNKYKQDTEEYIGYSEVTNENIYEDGESVLSTNSLYFRTALSIHF